MESFMVCVADGSVSNCNQELNVESAGGLFLPTPNTNEKIVIEQNNETQLASKDSDLNCVSINNNPVEVQNLEPDLDTNYGIIIESVKSLNTLKEPSAKTKGVIDSKEKSTLSPQYKNKIFNRKKIQEIQSSYIFKPKFKSIDKRRNFDSINKCRKSLNTAITQGRRKRLSYMDLKNCQDTLKMQIKLESQGFKVFENDPSRRLLKVIKTNFDNDDPPDVTMPSD